MPLLARLHGFHTIRQFHAAARLRFNEAMRLAVGGDRLSAIYLAGYAGEMLLKAAYFRLRGWTPPQPIHMADLRNARWDATHRRGVFWIGNLHDLAGWRDLLIAERRARGIPYAWGFRQSLTAQTRQLALNWSPELRYHTNLPRRAEVRVALIAASWLIRQFLTL